MPYAKGQSGNPKGRPKQTAEQKSQKEQFHVKRRIVSGANGTL